MERKLSAQEKQWRAEEDARTLARYEEIMGSSSRRNAAFKQAKAEASRLEKQANNYKSVTRKSK